MKRKRKHIPLKTKLAAALACLLPPGRRDELRRYRAKADDVLSLFEWDHIVLHAPPFNGSDAWWNMDPKHVAEHRKKSRRDTSIVAKVKRLRQAPAVAAGRPKPKTGSRHWGDNGRATGVPKRSWGIPGMRKKLNGEVVRR